jgi:hypothetical protein
MSFNEVPGCKITATTEYEVLIIATNLAKFYKCA